MDITDVRIFIPNLRDKRLLGFASVTFDGVLVVKEIRILDGREGWFISMPARKKDQRCKRCFEKNHLMAKFCNECGIPLTNQPIIEDGRNKRGLFEDTCHPTTSDFRTILQDVVLNAYEEELERIQTIAKTQLPQVQEVARIPEDATGQDQTV